MSEEYNQAISKHYAAYRPPLSSSYNLGALPQFQLGLDIGCGTGVSTLALAKYCQQLHGVDPSTSMIEQTKPSAGIGIMSAMVSMCHYQTTVWMSWRLLLLSYAKSAALVTELQRVCQSAAHVVVYDFEVLLEEAPQAIRHRDGADESNYDHAINFSDCDAFQAMKVYKETVS